MQQLRNWIAGTEPAALTLLLWLGALVVAAVVGMVFGRRAERRKAGQSEPRRPCPGRHGALPIAGWIEEGKQLFNVWQERLPR